MVTGPDHLKKTKTAQNPALAVHATLSPAKGDSCAQGLPREGKKIGQEVACLFLLLVVWLGVSIPRLKGPINFQWDASTYYMLGTALAEGHGYRLLNEPGEIEAVQYPPLLPLMVAAHQRVMGTSDYFKVGSALRLTYFVLSGLFLLMTYVFARTLLSPLYAVFVGMITALSFYVF